MNTFLLLDDAQSRPDIFYWNGRMDAVSMRTWLDQNQWMGPCPSDLIAFWEETGGGDVFETETILGPLSDPEMGDDIDIVNQELRARGMPGRFVVYHNGLLMSAADTAQRDYVELDPSDFRVLRRFGSLNEWYRTTLRTEYQDRYSLT